MDTSRVLDALDLSACVVDERGRLVLTNRSWERFRAANGGSPAACGVGADYLAACARASHPDAAVVGDGLRDVLAGRAERFALDYPCPTAGREGWWQVVATPLGRGAVVVHQDVTDRVRAVRRVTALGELSTMVAVGAGLEGVFAGAARHARLLLGAQAAAVLRREDARCATVLAHSTRDDARLEDGTRIELAEHEAADLATAGRGITRRRHPPEEDSVAARLGYRSSLAAPVLVGGRAWGLVAAAFTEPEPPRHEGTRLLEALAELVAVAVVREGDRTALARQATTDPLTGLANRRAFLERLDQEVARAQRHGRPLSVALADVDRFKRVNDRAGHAEGDRVLADVAGALRQASRSADLVARLGGDEFVVVLPEVDSAGALVFADRARAAVAALAPAAGAPVSVSVGVSALAEARDASELLQQADRALYAVKALERGGARAWSDL